MLEFALQCYQQGLISLGKAAELSGVQRSEFENLLAELGIERPGSLQHLQSDLDWARIGTQTKPAN